MDIRNKDKSTMYNVALRDTISRLISDKYKLRKSLNKIASMCGNPDAIDACRLILKECQEATK